jgi:hypothetical protein
VKSTSCYAGSVVGMTEPDIAMVTGRHRFTVHKVTDDCKSMGWRNVVRMGHGSR